MFDYKFRGKSHADADWVYGSLVVLPTFTAILEYDADENAVTRCFVNPDTVGQFTGAHDSNGRELYKGDILSFWPTFEWTHGEDDKRFGVVTFEHFAWRVRYKMKNGKEHTESLFNLVANKGSLPFTYVGNIYTNPELLERSQ